jgi:hypothetical protein
MVRIPLKLEDLGQVMGHAPVVLLTIPVVATLVGGLFAIRASRYRAALVAVGAGLLLGAAFLDLLPEAVELGESAGMKAATVRSRRGWMDGRKGRRIRGLGGGRLGEWAAGC